MPMMYGMIFRHIFHIYGDYNILQIFWNKCDELNYVILNYLQSSNKTFKHEIEHIHHIKILKRLTKMKVKNTFVKMDSWHATLLAINLGYLFIFELIRWADVQIWWQIWPHEMWG